MRGAVVELASEPEVEVKVVGEDGAANHSSGRFYGTINPEEK